MAKSKQVPNQATVDYSPNSAGNPPIIWRLYPLAWCVVGIAAGTYVFSSDASSKFVALLSSETAVVERRVADVETRAAETSRQLARAKAELREERSRVVALNIRIDKLASELRSANAGRLSTASVTTSAQNTVTSTSSDRSAPSEVTTTIVNTRPATAPDTSKVVTVNRPVEPQKVVALVDPNPPPLPARVPQQARTAARAAAAVREARNNQSPAQITTGSIVAAAVQAPKPAERAPSATRQPGATQWAAPQAPTPQAAQPRVTASASSSAALRLATAPSLQSLRQSWSLLMDRHPDILQGLSPRYRDITTTQGRSFQLIAGPLLSRGEAIQLCAMLQVQAVGCGVDNYAGAPL